MKTWKFENCEVIEKEFDNDLHILEVSNVDGNLLGVIYPACIDDMTSLFNDLDNGSNPINDGWEDGAGNTCSEKGW